MALDDVRLRIVARNALAANIGSGFRHQRRHQVIVRRAAEDPLNPDVVGQMNAMLSRRRDGDHTELHKLLTIRQIMTPRSEFRCAAAHEIVGDVLARVPGIYDEVPVVDGDPEDTSADVIGMLRRRDIHQRNARDHVERHLDDMPPQQPLSPETTILDFARRASSIRVALVGAPHRIEGLVTLYDLERLHVRIALFAHIVDFEERMGWFIQKYAPDPAKWPDFVGDHRVRAALVNGIERSRKPNHIGAPILAIGFTEKIALLKNLHKARFASKRLGTPLCQGQGASDSVRCG